jgi:hypothetical protein
LRELDDLQCHFSLNDEATRYWYRLAIVTFEKNERPLSACQPQARKQKSNSSITTIAIAAAEAAATTLDERRYYYHSHHCHHQSVKP